MVTHFTYIISPIICLFICVTAGFPLLEVAPYSATPLQEIFSGVKAEKLMTESSQGHCQNLVNHYPQISNISRSKPQK